MAKSSQQTFESLALPELEFVYRVARRLTHDPDEAEDLVQETYLKAFKSFETFELREYGIRPWLLRILHNAFLNRRARASKAPLATDQQILEEDRAAPPGDESATPPELDYERLDQEVVKAIDALSPEYRSVVLLWGSMEFSYQEIADILHVPIGTVMSRLHRARRELTRVLADYARENRLVSDRGQS